MDENDVTLFMLGDTIGLADGTSAEFIAYSTDLRSAEIAIEDAETGELVSISIPRHQIKVQVKKM